MTTRALAARHVAVRTRSRRLPRPLPHVFLFLVCALWLVPIIALLVSSFRPAFDIATTGWWQAGQTGNLSLTNYERVLSTGGLAVSFANSLLIAVPAVSVLTCVGSVAAFALARFRFRGRAFLVAALLALLVLPVQLTLVPVLRLYGALGLTGTFVGIWLVHIGFALPFAVYLLRGFFAALPKELFEAAVIDGAPWSTVFTRVALPPARPAIAAVAIFQLIWIWNDLLIALIFLGGDPSVAPLTVTVSNLVSSTTGEGWELLTAAAFVSMAFPMVVFLTLQRFFVRGLLAGSVK